jgi:hypothetical protein
MPDIRVSGVLSVLNSTHACSAVAYVCACARVSVCMSLGVRLRIGATIFNTDPC